MDLLNDSTEDFYTLLNCDESSSVEQIAAEFKVLARKHHPDKITTPEGKAAAEKHFVLLKKARDVLVDVDMRRKYDQWRAGFRMWMKFDDWLKMQSRVLTSIHWATSIQKMPSLEQGETPDTSSVSCSTSSNDERRDVVGGEGGREERKSAGREDQVSSPLQQFRSCGGGRSRVNQFRNYQL